jgi:hypothetical protein
MAVEGALAVGAGGGGAASYSYLALSRTRMYLVLRGPDIQLIRVRESDIGKISYEDRLPSLQVHTAKPTVRLPAVAAILPPHPAM